MTSPAFLRLGQLYFMILPPPLLRRRHFLLKKEKFWWGFHLPKPTMWDVIQGKVVRPKAACLFRILANLFHKMIRILATKITPWIPEIMQGGHLLCYNRIVSLSSCYSSNYLNRLLQKRKALFWLMASDTSVHCRMYGLLWGVVGNTSCQGACGGATLFQWWLLGGESEWEEIGSPDISVKGRHPMISPCKVLPTPNST